MAFQHLIILAEALGKQRAIEETLERCSFEGVGPAVVAARKEYERRKLAVVEEVVRLLDKAREEERSRCQQDINELLTWAQVNKLTEEAYRKGKQDQKYEDKEDREKIGRDAMDAYRREQLNFDAEQQRGQAELDAMCAAERDSSKTDSDT